MRIAIAMNDSRCSAHLAGLIQDARGCCASFADGEQATHALKNRSFDLVLLGWNMPGFPGKQVLGWMQNRLLNPPLVIVVTQRSARRDALSALNAGAADYIISPEEHHAAQKRIIAAIRSKMTKDSPSLNHGEFSFDPSRQCATYRGEVIDLRAREFALAHMLFENLNRPVARNKIMTRLWNSAAKPGTRTLDMHISRIRKRLHLKPERGVNLKSIFGFGYRLESCAATVPR